MNIVRLKHSGAGSRGLRYRLEGLKNDFKGLQVALSRDCYEFQKSLSMLRSRLRLRLRKRWEALSCRMNDGGNVETAYVNNVSNTWQKRSVKDLGTNRGQGA